VKTGPQRTVKTVLPTRHEVCMLRKESYNELVRHIAFHPPTAKSHTKIHSTHNISGGYGEWPDLSSPAVGGHVKLPPEGRYVVHVQQELPPRQVKQAPRPQHVQQMPPPHQVQRPLTTPYIQHNAFNSPHTSSRQTERTPLLQSVQPVPYIAHQSHIHETSPQAQNECCALGDIMGLVVIGLCVLGIYVWVSANT
jgi:hypothetical protein